MNSQLTSAMKAAFAAVVLAGAAGAAFSQGTPPTTSSPNPATGAGQQSPAGGPMGTTGVTPQSPGAATGSTTPPPATATTTPPSQDPTTSTEPMRTARADRN